MDKSDKDRLLRCRKFDYTVKYTVFPDTNFLDSREKLCIESLCNQEFYDEK